MTDTTKMATHTSAPWSIGKIREGSVEIQTPSGAICELMTGTEELELPPDVEADARLIAAAPDLLAACKATLPPLEQRQPWHVMLEAAIAKAEGGGV